MAVHVSDISLLLPYAVRFQMYTARNGGMMLTAPVPPALSVLPDVDPVVQLPDDVVLKAGLLATVTVCVCAPADSVLAVTELLVPCTAYLALHRISCRAGRCYLLPDLLMPVGSSR